MHILLWIIGILAAAAALGAIGQALATRRDARRYPPPGRLVDIGGHSLHVLEMGQGSTNAPTILLEAGLMSTVLSWTGLQARLAQSFRVVSYDRAGLGWSDLGPMPRTADRIVSELHTLLDRAKIPAPYVLVGHSFGGLTMPLFAARYPNEVAGMVLIDGVAPIEWNPPSARDARLTRIGARVCHRSAFLARIGLIRFVAFLLTTPAKKYGAHLVRLISRGAPDESGTVSSPWFAALPGEEKEMAAVFWIQPKFALTIASQLENLPASAAAVAQAGASCQGPVIIFSAGTSSEPRRQAHAAMAKAYPLGENHSAPRSNHWIMQQNPELVVAAVEKAAAHYEKSRAATSQPTAIGASAAAR
jgi:pimeloyl-ACP methyl ester carboxylesterase